MPPWAPAGPPLLHGSRDNLNWSMCHCNLPIPPSLTPSSIPANCHTGVHKHCCPSAGQNTGQGPSHFFFAYIQKKKMVSDLFLKANITKSSLTPPSSFPLIQSCYITAYNSIFNSHEKRIHRFLFHNKTSVKTFSKTALGWFSNKTRQYSVVKSKLNAQIQCLFSSTSCLPPAKRNFTRKSEKSTF